MFNHENFFRGCCRFAPRHGSRASPLLRTAWRLSQSQSTLTDPVTREAEVRGAAGGAELFGRGGSEWLNPTLADPVLSPSPGEKGGLLNTVPWTVTRGEVRTRHLVWSRWIRVAQSHLGRSCSITVTRGDGRAVEHRALDRHPWRGSDSSPRENVERVAQSHLTDPVLSPGKLK